MLNRQILHIDVQDYINQHLGADVHKIAMGKSPFPGVEARELANQIAAKRKSAKKLPTLFQRQFIYYPALLSIEQCSSEVTAVYKSGLAIGSSLVDLTGGFGIDSLFFARKIAQVTHCEINLDLSYIAKHNSEVMGQGNINFVAGNGLEYIAKTEKTYDTIYIDPARRSSSGKVFMLKDCTPNIVDNLDLLLTKSKRVIIKTAPLLDISAGLKELSNVMEIHIVSVRNECKELLWVLERRPSTFTKIVAVTLNEQIKEFTFAKGDGLAEAEILDTSPISGYLYEPDAALMKSGGFNLIGSQYGLKKLHSQTQLYHSHEIEKSFPGRIFRIIQNMGTGELKKLKGFNANVISRNYPDKAEGLQKKYKIKPHDHRFLIFTQTKADGFLIIEAEILQHY